MAEIHTLFGHLAEQNARTENNLNKLKSVLQGLKAGTIDLAQVEFTPGGFKVNPKVEAAGETAKPEAGTHSLPPVDDCKEEPVTDE